MAGSTGIGESKEAKRMKYSDAQPMEVEEEKTEAKAKEVLTNKVSESSSEKNSHIQQEGEEVEEETEVASDAKCRTIAKTSRGKIIGLLLHIKKRAENSVIRIQEQEKSAVSGDSYENDIEEFKLPEILLFKVRLPRSNRLVVPADEAGDFFPSLSGRADAAEVLQITDYREDEWNMSFTYYREEHAFVFTKGWIEFAAFHELKAMDVIRFYRPVPRLASNHYRILYKRRYEDIPKALEFRRESFLFQLKLDAADIGYCRLFIRREQVEIHFPGLKQVYGTPRKKEIVRFTDAEDKNWYMSVTMYNVGTYMIIDGWHEFVKEHNLGPMDVIKFYKPVHPSHKKHFLIEVARKVEADPNLSQSAALWVPMAVAAVVIYRCSLGKKRFTFVK